MGLFNSLEEFADAVAIIDEAGLHHSYTDLIADADQIALTIPAGSLVLFVARNCYASIAAYVGFLRAGVVPLMLPSTTKKADIEKLTERFRPPFTFMPHIPAEDYGQDYKFGRAIRQFNNYSLYKTNCEADYVNHTDLALLLSTSGSTGSKSFVRLSRDNLECNSSQICKYLGIKASDRAITTMPMSYSYGLSIINSHLVRGASIVATEASLVNPSFWQLLKAEKVTTFGGVPFIYDMLKKLKFHQMDIPGLRYITQAGGKLSDDLLTYFGNSCRDKDTSFFVMYGQTEATARMTYLPHDRLLEKIGSVGIPVPGAEIWLEDKHGNKVTASHQPGELVFKGKNVSHGYAENRFDLALGDQNHGTLKTGDIAEQDDDGFYRIVGRKSRFLKLFGNRVNLADIENSLSEFGFIAACTGTDDNLRIFIEDEANLEAAGKIIKTTLNLPPKGYRLIPIAQIPRGEAGKISYPLLNAEFGAG